MKTRNGLLCVFLCAVLVGTSGCVASDTTTRETTTQTLAPELAEYLQIPDALLESLADSVQTVDQTSRGETTTVQVKQTLGNTRELYVLYSVTIPEETVFTTLEEGAVPVTAVTLSGKSGSVIPLEVDGRSETYISYFEGPSQGWKGQEVQLELICGPSKEVHTLSWTSTTQGEIREGTVTAESGETMGTLSLSPFSLRFDLLTTAQTEMEASEAFTEAFLDSIAIVDQNGTTKQPKGGRSLSSTLGEERVHGSIDFSQVLDLNAVAAVQIDGYTVPLL